MLSVSRRGLLALGGTGVAAIALAGCGEGADQRDDASPDDLMQAELEAELALANAYSQAASTASDRGQGGALNEFAAASQKRADELRAAGAPDGEAPAAPDGGPDGAEALNAAITLANSAIAAHRQAAGLLNTAESRGLASAQLVAVAAELAATDGFAGNPQVPSAFVTGGDEEPFQSATDQSTASTTSTSSTSTTSTSTTETEQ